MASSDSNPSRSSGGPLILVGILWIAAAVIIVIYQIYKPVKIEVTWETATEINTAGFYLYRSPSPEGEFALINKQGELIPSTGDAFSGATYTFVDEDVQPGETYYYLLEEVESDLSSNRYEDQIFDYTVPRVNWLAIVVAAISIVVGPALVIMGLREK
jgi:hypothetical protein